MLTHRKLLLPFLWCCLSLTFITAAYGEAVVPCLFIFGDSLSDNGNNNNLNAFGAKVNYSPYGIDFIGKRATGRFSNGKNIMDFIAEHLGYEELVPPFAETADMTDSEILKGVNYASGAAGIRPESGHHLGDRMSLDRQFTNHKLIIERITKVLGPSTSDYLNKCLYLINIGSNDYISNYFVPNYYSTNTQFTPEQYANGLIESYSNKTEVLYADGARKIALFGVGALGCVPEQVIENGPLEFLCAHKVNRASRLFNHRLKQLVDHQQSKFTDATFTYINTDFILLSSSAGFLVLNRPCCQVNSYGLCTNGTTPCHLRKLHVFFDNFHPTEAMNSRVANRAYRSVFPWDAHPFDIQTLAKR